MPCMPFTLPITPSLRNLSYNGRLMFLLIVCLHKSVSYISLWGEKSTLIFLNWFKASRARSTVIPTDVLGKSRFGLTKKQQETPNNFIMYHLCLQISVCAAKRLWDMRFWSIIICCCTCLWIMANVVTSYTTQYFCSEKGSDVSMWCVKGSFAVTNLQKMIWRFDSSAKQQRGYFSFVKLTALNKAFHLQVAGTCPAFTLPLVQFCSHHLKEMSATLEANCFNEFTL